MTDDAQHHHEAEDARPLAGTLVVSVEQAVAAPFASRLLADAGARVIKIERPGGDFARGYDVAANGLSSYFAWLNHGKESLVLDLTTDGDRALMDRLVSRADVFIQNLAVGAAARLGLGSARLGDEHPRLITCDISGYGESGPYASMKAYDLLVQAESGLLSVSGEAGTLGRIGISVADIATGQAAALAISQALVRQATTGRGARLQTSLFATLAEWMTVPLLHHDYLGRAPAQGGLSHPSIAPYGAFATVDGYLLLISVQSDREWAALCRLVLGRSELVEDSRFRTNNDRVAHRVETDGVVAEVFGTMARNLLEERLRVARIAFGSVNDVTGLSHHPQLAREVYRHEHGEVAMPVPAVHADWLRQGSVPSLDEHGAAIRCEFGG